MIAVVDETCPEVRGGVLYVVVAALLLTDEVSAREDLRSSIESGRHRPFHYATEGPHARESIIVRMEQVGVLARAVVVPCGRRSQEAARKVALRELLPHLLDDGCRKILIESRSTAQDGRDRALIVDLLNSLGRAGTIEYSWQGKDEPLLWAADAVCGGLRGHLLGREDDFHGRISAATALEVCFRNLS